MVSTWILRFWLAAGLALLALSGTGAYLVFAPLPVRSLPLEVRIPVGASSRSAANALVEAGVPINRLAFIGLIELGGLHHHLRPGHYHFTESPSLWDVVGKFRRDDFERTRLTVTEGISLRDLRAMIAQTADLKHDTLTWSDMQVAQALGMDSPSPEGWFAPDTYDIDPDSSDLVLYRSAYQRQQKRLAAAWQQRDPDLPYRQPYEALIMASLIEKETGLPADRPMVASVFVNRQRIGMPLQTDPSVIYGLGAGFQGRLHKQDLLTDTVYNTYTRRGLPPTPIALPGRESIQAALHPAQSKALFFVSRGDGSTTFSETLAQHNHAVHQFLRTSHE